MFPAMRRAPPYAGGMWVISAVFAALFVVSVIREPRRVRCGVFLLAALVALGFGLLSLLMPRQLGEGGGFHYSQLYAVIAGLLLAIGAVVTLGVVLVWNGVTVVRREGRRLAHLLGLALGLVILLYVALSAVAVARNDGVLATWVVCAGIPLTYLGFGFTAYLIYSAMYLAVARRRGKPPAAVVVLGAGLIDGRVPPLLAARLTTGMAVVARAEAAGADPVFVVSGGQGSDEARPEAAAMAEFLTREGVDPGRIVQEDRSATTWENIANTKALLEARGVPGPVVAVTNNFHAFRAACLLRRAKLDGYAIPAPTARYYWPAAILREYVIVLHNSLVFNIVAVTLCFLPLAGLTIARLTG